MDAQTLLQEAMHESTTPELLLQLATSLDENVRRTAQRHPNLNKAHWQVLVCAEGDRALLTAQDLDWLARQGPFGVQVAAAHPKTADATLRWLVLAGHTQLVVKHQLHRTERWLLAQAAQDPGLMTFLQAHSSVPWPLRLRARALKHGFGNAPLLSPAPQPGGPSEETMALRAILRQRQETPELSDAQLELLSQSRSLQRLAARHPLLPVPLLEWLDQAEPYGQARETLLMRLEQHDLEPEEFARLARVGDWTIRAALARNVHLPAFLLPFLTQDADWWVRASAAENPNATPEQLAILAGEQEQAVIRENAAGHPHTPAETLLRLAEDGEAAVRLQTARNPSTPPTALALLAGDERYAAREAVAAHPLTPPEVLAALSVDVNERVRLVAQLRVAETTHEGLEAALATRRRNVKLAVASRPEVPAALLQQLARDRHPRVRAQAGLHRSLPDFERDTLLDDRDLSVQRAARAADPDARPAVLAALPRHDARIRQGLSRNPATPAPVLDQLSDDPLEDVRLAVVLNPAAPEGALQRRLPEQPLRPSIRQHPLYTQVQPSLHRLELEEARNLATPEETLDALLDSDAPKVRYHVALHPNASAAAQLRLTQDEHEHVRSGLTQREHLAEDIQQALAADMSVEVRTGLLGRPDISPEAMLRMVGPSASDEALLVAMTKHQAVTAEVLSALAPHPSVDVRARVARHERTPAAVQLHLASDPQESVAQEVLRNPSCGPEALAVLARQPRLRLHVARHARTSPQTLEALAFDRQYAQLLRLERALKKAPPRLQRHALVERWVTWMKVQASGRALKDGNVLAAVIRHPAASRSALQFASRLNNPVIEAAKADRKAMLRAAPSPDLEAPHE
ncbi:hypothetical protein DEDE109153_17740 [Deinococcus deserti]|uniref:Leucine rich repeat variant n=1 Tax=Deinococcus deserti (strain DSM 17065 / CIP 109153 / LMG 22923 / VCD115) TaxID=546414 RepID=C1D2V7_DEIDV|nr:hypothetical protein [Deinococcus deserti]ACO47746.1 hypothetical protein Deide_2p00810 [Deinococcus deserti VCD115]